MTHHPHDGPVLGEPGGALVVRIWFDKNSDQPVRARIRSIVAFRDELELEHFVAGPEEIIDEVRRWLGDVMQTFESQRL